RLAARTRAGIIGERLSVTRGYSPQWAGACPPRQLRNRDECDQCPVADDYLAVRLKARERWSYQPPAGHTVLWTAVGMGSVVVPDELRQGELVAFRPSSDVIEFEAKSDAEFVVGSAVPHDYDLVLGSHSVHTSAEALREAEGRISAIQSRLIQQGKL